MFGNCKIHTDIPLQLQEGERGKPALNCPKCVEERQNIFEKLFNSIETNRNKIKMHTVVVQIGNSDNKLTQVEWSHFIKNVDSAVSKIGEVHFTGFSAPDAPWQNACFIVNSCSMDGLASELRFICKRFGQDSIALTIGETEFIKG